MAAMTLEKRQRLKAVQSKLIEMHDNTKDENMQEEIFEEVLFVSNILLGKSDPLYRENPPDLSDRLAKRLSKRPR